MKVIFLSDVRGIGRRGDVKDVNDGYARNFLFPNKFAQPATSGAISKLEEHKAVLAHKDSEMRKHLAEVARKLGDVSIQFELAVGKDGSVFGSVNKEMILTALREHGFVTSERVEIHLEHPIKELGVHEVQIHLKKEIGVILKIVVTRK